MIDIKLVTSDEDVLICYPVLKNLHETLDEDSFLETFRRLENISNYQMAALFDSNEVKSVAGFHIGESFAWQRYIYVDDLVTDARERSKSYGAKILDWVKQYGIENNCKQIHLDTRVTRYQAQKFYLNQGLYLGGYHILNALDN